MRDSSSVLASPMLRIRRNLFTAAGLELIVEPRMNLNRLYLPRAGAAG